jgi:ribosome maturation factor RimP
MSTVAQREQLIDRVAALIEAGFPDVEIVDLDVHGGRGGRLTVYVDRPGGVDLALCEAVTKALDELRETYAVEVSSPGLDRPLRTPRHFEQALGSRVFVKTAAPRDGRSVYRGRLAAAGPEQLCLVADEGGEVRIDYDTIAKAHVIFEFDDNGGRRE